MPRKFAHAAAHGCTLLVLASPVVAQETYPNRPIRLIVPVTPGGGGDITSRAVAQKLNESWRQQVIVDNRPGAGGIVGLDILARSSPDGYTFALGGIGPLAVNQSLHSKLPYDPLRDFAPVSLVAESPFLLLVHPSLPVANLKELIAFARARPGQLTYASSGTGSSSHLGFELFNLMAGIKGVHVPYKGLPPATLDTISGYVTMTWNSITASMPYLKNRQLKALGIG